MRFSRTARRQLDKLQVNLGRRVKPKYLNFILTRKCQSRCFYCNIWKVAFEQPELIKQEMSYNEIKAAFVRDKDFLNELEFVQLTGGEPFLKDKIVETAELMYDVAPNLESMWIPSNGLATKLVVGKVRQMIDNKGIKKFGVSISIDGRETYHDKVRGRKGFFRKTKRTLDKLAKLSREHEKLEVSLGFTIGKKNWKDLMFAYELSKGLDIDFTTRPVNFSEVYYLNTEKKLNSGLSEEEVVEISKQVGEIEDDMLSNRSTLGGLNYRTYFGGMIKYIRDPFTRFFPCYSGALSLAIDPIGNVFPCLYMPKKLGNIREKPLKEIWGSKKAREVWKAIRKNQCPNCWIECESQKNITYEIFKAMNPKFRNTKR